MHKITPYLWFDGQAEEAARFYTSIFKNSKITGVTRYPEGSPAPAGSAMIVNFELEGLPFTALNGGPHYKFTEAISFSSAARRRRRWTTSGTSSPRAGEEQPCGWLKDKFGLSWQIIPDALGELLSDPDPEKASRVMQAMLQMKKIDIAALEQAAA